MIRRIALATAAVTAAALTSGITWSATANATTPAGGPPAADTTASLPLGRFTDMVVDQDAGLVFYAGDTPIAPDGYGGGVAVSKLDGTAVQLIPNSTSTIALALGPDGKIYAAEENQNIAVIDPASLTVTQHPTGDGKCPTSIAFAGSALWFSYQCGFGGAAGVATLDLATDTVTATASPVTPTPSPRIVTVPGHPDLLAGTNFEGNGEIDLLAVDGTGVTVAHQSSSYGSPLLKVSADGSDIYATSASLLGTATFSTTDLTKGSIVYLGSQAITAAVSADSSLVAVSAGQEADLDYISTFHAGSTTPIRTYDTSTPGRAGQGQNTNPAANGIAWNGSTLLAVYVDYIGGYPLLKVLNSATFTPTAMSLRSVTAVGRARALPMTGHLAATTGQSLAGKSVVVAKRDSAGAHPIGTFITDANGMYHFTDVPAVGGLNTYVAVYAGDATYMPVTTVNNVNVLRGTPVLTMNVTSKLYNFHQLGHLTVHLQSHDVKKVQIWVKAGPAAVHYYTTLTVNSQGNAAMNMTMTFNTVFVVKFYGDYYYNARVISTAVGTRAAIVAANAGNYATSGAYDLFHKGDDVYQGTIVYPNQYGLGSCVHFTIYIWYQGSWQDYASSPCLTLNTSGVGFARLPGAYVTPGYLYRAQSTLNSNQYNVGNVSNFVYFTTR